MSTTVGRSKAWVGERREALMHWRRAGDNQVLLLDIGGLPYKPTIFKEPHLVPAELTT